MKIYTKKGDLGKTSLSAGREISKASQQIAAQGAIDELSSLIGVVLSFNPSTEIAKVLLRVQKELFVLGAELSKPFGSKIKIPKIQKTHIARLEKEINQWQKKLAKLKNFILPGGKQIGATLHLTRAVARRAEREIVKLAEEEKVSKNALIYLNRLSDWLFILARYANHQEGVKENLWKK